MHFFASLVPIGNWCADNMDDLWIGVITSMVLIGFSVLMGLCMVKCMYMMDNNNRVGQSQAEMVVVVA